jgi:hypothetical protein
MNDPWAVDPPKITAHQVARIVELIADYTTAEATELIHTLASRRNAGECGACKQVGRHSDTCVTQGRD